MDFKIIKSQGNTPDVLLYRDRDYDEKTENDVEKVVIMAWGFQGDMDDMLATEVIEFENTQTAQSFIEDFTQKSAAAWCQVNGTTTKAVEGEQTL